MRLDLLGLGSDVTKLPSPAHGRRGENRSTMGTLRLVLVAGAVWNASFALYLLQQREQSVTLLLQAFIKFAFVDGILALAAAGAYLVVTPSRMLWLPPAVDAATRAALVAVAATGPGLLDVPLTAVLYLGLVATFTFCDGVADLAEGVSVDRELGRRSGWLPLVISGAVGVLVGVLLVLAYPGVWLMRGALIALSAAHAVARASGVRHASLLSVPRPSDAR
jgi:hypothetical protein